MADLQRRLDYRSFTYVSRIDEDVIQVVFRENQYTGLSVDEGRDFYEKLQSAGYKQVVFKGSGVYLNREQRESVLGVVFGTLGGVLVVFALIFYVNGGGKFRIWTQLNLLRHRTSVFNTPFFARFDNTDENVIIGGSLRGSVASLAKSFDNPLYGKDNTPSTSPTTSSGVQHENPLYEVALKDDEVVDNNTDILEAEE